MTYIESRGVRTYFVDVGNGNPLILLHGWGQSSEMWKNIINTLALHNRVITPDLPGFGKSGTPPNTSAWGVTEYALWLQDFLNALGVQAPSIIGHSFGGSIGIGYSKYNKVRNLFLYSCAPCLPNRSIFSWFNVILIRLLRRIAPVFLYRTHCNFLHPNNYTNFVECSRERANRMLTIYTKKSAHIDGPFHADNIVIISGTKDWIVNEKRSARSAKLLGAKLYVIPGADHFAHISHTHEFVFLITHTQ